MTLWSKTVDSTGVRTDNVKGLDVCGAATEESLLGERVQVIVKHDQPNLDIYFGSTLKSDPTIASYGISDVEIYILK